jgi:C4-dicarboxylate transporter, DctM subunit
MIGLMSPPHGALLFILMGISKIQMKDLVRELVPFWLALLVLLGIVTYIPDLVLCLPRWLG